MKRNVLRIGGRKWQRIEDVKGLGDTVNKGYNRISHHKL